MTFGNLTIATPPKPDALRLADALEFGAPFVVDRDLVAAELRRLHAENERLREAARMALDALDDAGSRICEVAHHAKADRHDIGEPCPVERRRDAAIDALRAALEEDK